jgi:hypothetical protein
MGWNAVIENIVTDAELTSAINALKTNDVDGLAAINNDLATKLDIIGGTANGLLLTNVGSGSTAAISRQELTDATAIINQSIALKASLSATFVGTVIVPDGSANNHAVNLGQLNAKLNLSGGTVTGNISAGTAPSTGVHLTNKTYVDANIAPKADLTYVDSEISNLLTDGQPVKEALDLKAPLANPTFTGSVQATVSIQTGDNSTKLATTQWVQTELASVLPAKAPLNAPAFTGAPTVTIAPDLADDSNKIPTTAWVRDVVAAMIA